MVNIDIPTAFAAVIISVILSFLKDNVTEITQNRLQNRRQDYEEKIKWLQETQALAERIEAFAISAHEEHLQVNQIEDEVFESFKREVLEIDISDVSTYSDFEEQVESIDGVNEIGIPFNAVQETPTAADLDIWKESVINNFRSQVDEEYRESLRSKTQEEMDSFFQELIRHYSM